jgi:hypothetical protein
MGLVLQLVETGAESRTRSIDVTGISRPGDLRDIAGLGLTSSGAKQLLAGVQQVVVAAQARDQAALRPECASCGGRRRCHVKD